MWFRWLRRHINARASEVDYLRKILERTFVPGKWRFLASKLMEAKEIKDLMNLLEEENWFLEDFLVKKYLDSKDFDKLKERMAYLLIEKILRERL